MGQLTENELKIRRIAGGSIMNYPPLYSADGEIIFVVWNNIVRMYSATTGEWLRDLEGIKDGIVGLHLDLFDSQVLLGCSLSGEICSWKWKSGLVAKKGNMNMPVSSYIIRSFDLIDLDGNHSSGLIAWQESNNRNIRLNYFNLDNKSVIQSELLDGIRLSKSPIKIAVGSQLLNYFGVIQQIKALVVFTKTGIIRSLNCLYGRERFGLTDIVCHPEEQLILIGDAIGHIFLFRELDESPQYSLYHWHSTPVSALSFSELGSSFYSGGRERVLVKWTIDKPELKQFLPRLPGQIVHIALSPGNHRVAVTTNDNGILILNSYLKQIGTIQHFTWIPPDRRYQQPFPVGLKIHPRTSSIVLNGREGKLQFFSTHSNSLLYNIEITDENTLNVENDKNLYNSRITKTALSMDWMATAEVIDDLEHISVNRLKFWLFDSKTQNYSLNTNIEMPHLQDITGLEFSSYYSENNLNCASTGNDNYVKIWSPIENDSIYQKGKIWYCIAKAQYKNLPIKSLSFSQDGSILASGCGNTLCIWNSENLTLKCALSTPLALDGNVGKVVISVSDSIRHGNGVKSNIKKMEELKQKQIVENRNKLLTTVRSFLNGTDNQFLKIIKLKTNHKKFEKFDLRKINLTEKELLFKRILSLDDLSLFHKFQMFSYLKIGVQCTDENYLKLIRTFKQELIRFQKREINNKIYNLSEKDKYVMKKKLHEFKLRKKNYFDSRNIYLLPYHKYLRSDKKPKVDPIDDKDSNSSNLFNGHGNISCEEKNTSELGNENYNELTEKLTNELNDLPIKVISQINHVLFGGSEFAHLVVVCTENRLMVWNLLTLKLQSSLNISVKYITIDPYTNLIAAFTVHSILYIFQPNTPLPLYRKKNMPDIYGAVWIPRRISRQQNLNLDWQSVSQLYFLNKQQELLYLISDNDDDGIAQTIALSYDNPQPLTPFRAILSLDMDSKIQKYNNGRPNMFTSFGVLGMNAANEVASLSTHTLGPVHKLCKNFLTSLLTENIQHRVEKSKLSETEANAHEISVFNDGSESENENELNKKIIKRKKLLSNCEKITETKTRTETITIESKLKRILQLTFDL